MIDYIMKLEKENKNLKRDTEAVELFYYLLQHFDYKSYNPKGDYYVVAFTIDDKNKNRLLEKYILEENAHTVRL